jgi:hypothetical protein
MAHSVFPINPANTLFMTDQLLTPVATQITRNKPPTMVDTPVMLIFYMVQSSIHNLAWSLMQPEIP